MAPDATFCQAPRGPEHCTLDAGHAEPHFYARFVGNHLVTGDDAWSRDSDDERDGPPRLPAPPIRT